MTAMTDEQIEALVKQHTWFNGSHAMTDYRKLVRAAIALAAQPAQAAPEPVAWMNPDTGFAPDAFIWTRDERCHPEYKTPVYTAATVPAPVQAAEPSRVRFEQFFAWSRQPKGVSRRPTFEQLPDGTYADDPTQRHWWTWQNATHPAPPMGSQDRRDAERYRWLRANISDQVPFQGWWRIAGPERPERLDEAIDAELAAPPEFKQEQA